jgi:hypothetical protein
MSKMEMHHDHGAKKLNKKGKVQAVSNPSLLFSANLFSSTLPRLYRKFLRIIQLDCCLLLCLTQSIARRCVCETWFSVRRY